MSKGAQNKNIADLTRFSKSTFTLTFAIEVLGIDVWHDCNGGWLDLGACQQGMRLQYQLYPGQSFDVDILIWPHVAKIWCGNQYGYVRTWQFLERRWMAFTIRHVFPVRVVDFIDHVATITPTVGLGALSATAKNDKNVEAFLPSLKFMERRYFGPVLEKEESLEKWIQNCIWRPIKDYIPSSYLDGSFDTPQNVTDVRHQDAVLNSVQEAIFNSMMVFDEEETQVELEEIKSKERRESKSVKEKEKKKVVETPKVKYEIRLSGNTILAGAGRIVTFETIGDRPPDLGEVIALISSNNLPAEDDLPIIFVNVMTLSDLPIEELRKLRVSQVYTQYKIGEHEHQSQKQQLKPKKPINFNDYHTIPLPLEKATEIIHAFMDTSFQIQLRGIRIPQITNKDSRLFGHEKNDQEFGTTYPLQSSKYEDDFLIAVTQIDATELSKGVNGLIRGEFPLFPPKPKSVKLKRVEICTNDINAIRFPVKPDVVVEPFLVLKSHMMLELSMGLVGCKPQSLSTSFSRLYCHIRDSVIVTEMLQAITDINMEIILTSDKNFMLTGFALDTGDLVVFYIEGQKDGPILKIWEKTGDFYPKIKPVFSTSDCYLSRIYPEMLSSAIPFNLLKMFVPLCLLLGCPAVYARPTLPLPARSALLKIGRLTASSPKLVPCCSEIPTGQELESFRLELCVPPFPSSINSCGLNLVLNPSHRQTAPLQSSVQTHWDKDIYKL